MTNGKEDSLVITLEPEAASVWCKKLPADGFITENHGDIRLDQTPGTQYIVVDCGGTLFLIPLQALKVESHPQEHFTF